MNPIKKWLRNRVSGVTGEFVKEFTNFRGVMVVVLTERGREYCAPKHEWVNINENR